MENNDLGGRSSPVGAVDCTNDDLYELPDHFKPGYVISSKFQLMIRTLRRKHVKKTSRLSVMKTFFDYFIGIIRRWEGWLCMEIPVIGVRSVNCIELPRRGSHSYYEKAVNVRRNTLDVETSHSLLTYADSLVRSTLSLPDHSNNIHRPAD